MISDNIIKIVFTFFQFIGLCPISKDSKIYFKNNFFKLWSLFCILSILPHSIYLFTTIYIDDVYNLYDKLNFSIAISKAIIIILTHFTIIFESLFTRYNQWLIWNNFQKFNEIFEKLNEPINTIRNSFQQKFLWKCIIYQLFSILIEIFIVSKFLNRIFMVKYWYATTISLMVTRIRLCQEIFYIDMITMGYTVLNIRLEQLLLLLRSNNVENVVDGKFKVLAKAYILLYEILNNFKKICGVSQLANLTLNFMQITGDLFWLYQQIYYNLYENAIDVMFKILPSAIILILLTVSCEKCIKQVIFVI